MSGDVDEEVDVDVDREGGGGGCLEWGFSADRESCWSRVFSKYLSVYLIFGLHRL